MEILASLREKGASRVRVRRCPKWTTSTTPVGLPAHAAFAGRIEKCRADCRQNHQEAFPGDGDVALLCYPTSISPSSTRDPESAEAGRGTRFLCVSRSRSRDRSHYCCGRSPGALARWAEALAPARQRSRQRHAGGDERTSSFAQARPALPIGSASPRGSTSDEGWRRRSDEPASAVGHGRHEALLSARCRTGGRK